MHSLPGRRRPSGFGSAGGVPMICTMDTVGCPACGHAMTRVVDGGVRFSCSSCRGHFEGVAPFEHDHPGQGRRLWVAAERGEQAGPCPFCSRRLLRPAVADAPPGLAVCRLCEQVWVPADAEPWLEAHRPNGAPAPPPTAAHPDECPGCGAPWAPDPAGCCRYCKEQLSSGPTTAIIVESPPDGRPGVLGTLLAGIDRGW
jgi:hypothetical protein